MTGDNILAILAGIPWTMALTLAAFIIGAALVCTPMASYPFCIRIPGAFCAIGPSG